MLRTTAPQNQNSKFIDSDSDTGVAGTTIVAKDLNFHQEEIAKLIEAAGITLSADDDQASVASAIIAAETLLPRMYSKGVMGDGFSLSVSGNTLTVSKGIALSDSGTAINSIVDLNLDISGASTGDIYVTKGDDGKAVLAVGSTPSNGIKIGTLSGNSGSWTVSNSGKNQADFLNNLGDIPLKQSTFLSNANSYAHYQSNDLDGTGLTLYMNTTNTSNVGIETGQGIIFTMWEDIALTSAQRALPIYLVVRNANGNVLISKKIIKLRNADIPSGNFPQDSVFQAYYRGDYWELSAVLPYPKGTITEGNNGYNKAAIIYPDWFIQSVGNALFPVGTDYIQFPKLTISGTLYHGKTPSDRKLPGVWQLLFGTTGAFFRTEGGSAGSFDSASLQASALYNHSHIMTSYAGTSSTSGTTHKIWEATNSDTPWSGSGSTISVISTQSAGGGSGEGYPKNYTIRIWRRTL